MRAVFRNRVVRPVGVIVFGLVPALALVGCGEDATGARTTLVDIQPSSYVTRPPATTTTTIAPEDVEADAEGRLPVEQTYVIKPGDYPNKIAQRYGISTEELANYNSETPGYDSFIVGTEILIPPNALVPGGSGADEAPADDSGDGSTDAGDGEATAPQTTLAPAGDCTEGTYTITADDTTRTAVANRFDVTVEELDAANANTPGYSAFYPGLEIVIPC